jgi:hypothetical protein
MGFTVLTNTLQMNETMGGNIGALRAVLKVRLTPKFKTETPQTLNPNIRTVTLC